ncbi:pyridoxal 5'-phosphate synthase glutaminase subunit PdxT [Clostridium tyrobutyricum]|uniref:Pyridoxal 5'-phosphate synthase subunit PdxT n=1 Tax=Clostridium tyrobutyricum DIVETGP TaxID=1408889 RepID=W6NI32_CLOTY|nr:pyridoxal 5'-phosphate synthase glutaminase subunit PdxT [Clostridium tyrobutyricum]AND85428.1 glutamine amidotransferase subunit PdxT [Clostridium tyrobutyricum]ANP69975.1 glutamine amidotransferase subunit PdxT [Clostridium tyrobutyricum]MBV4434030.1 pyridoxal 5'-phosphate synthase glutaminase subunit PdxT [Clostridium tyrobutyricum]QNB65664.1 pyridoxal 5'-phosphate synthase glutaminase subunit PdxT [Clostridium tyrobutyricum]CDL91702.1 Pyridoxine biosynthesis glutamine amidotransferase, 
MKIGVLSFQGGVKEHMDHIKSLGTDAVEIKDCRQLDEIDGIILPGGESTTMGKLLEITKMMQPLREKILNGLPVWGTCAGMILLANSIEDSKSYLSVIDISVRRNAYGSQIDSFRDYALIPEVSDFKIPLVFIRAPFITHLGDNVKRLCTIRENVVAARHDNVLVTSFHPELTEDLKFHEYFLSMI